MKNKDLAQKISYKKIELGKIEYKLGKLEARVEMILQPRIEYLPNAKYVRYQEDGD